eukprot:gene21132-biopygen10156
MHRAPGLAGADRTQKVAIWWPKNRLRCPLTLHRGRVWLPGGTHRKSKFQDFGEFWSLGDPPAPPPLHSVTDVQAGSCRLGHSIPSPPGSPIQP